MKIKHAVITMCAAGIACHLGIAEVLGAEGEATQPDTPLVADSPQQDAVSVETVTPEESQSPDQSLQSDVVSGDTEVLGQEEKPEASSTVEVSGHLGLADAIRRHLNPVGEVIGSPDEKVLLSEGDVVSLRIASSIDPKPNQTFALVRSAQRVKHPKTRRDLGRLTKVIGTIKLEEAFGQFWSGRIMRSSDFVESGDLVVPFETAVATGSSDRSLTPDHGYIVAVPDEAVLTAAFQTVYTDLGQGDAVETGHVLAIIREGKSGRRGGPPRKIGEARVLRVEPDSSAVYITQSSEPIQIGDRLEPVSGESPR
ncbi:MAG: hypothetical protein HY207_12550 [Nitrospirae bacterium]|nr:hypothetical protein [Nitrospirota bacterium]